MQTKDGSDEPALVRRLVQLDALIRAAPPLILGSYQRLLEAQLGPAMESRCAALEMGHSAWSTADAADPIEILRPVAVEARAVDQLLRRGRPREVPSNPGKTWRAAGLNRYVVPLRARHTGRTGDNQPYERRGLQQHRLLPCRLGRYTIRLVAAGGVAPLPPAVGPMRPFTGGAALFQELSAETAGVEGKLFTVTKCRAANHSAQIETHVVAAHEQGCSGLVWAELTMNPDDRKQVRGRLRGRAATDLAKHRALEFVVAGTWHEPRKGKKSVNRGVIFDGFGELLTDFIKTQAFHTKAWGTEDIDEGTTITILVLEDRLIGFGICKDFCDVHEGNPFPKLDLDYYVVPSMGGRVTTEGHIITARRVGGAFGARSFVVQQSEPDLEDQLGFVVPPLKDLSGFDAQAALQTNVFKSYGTD